MKPYNHKTDYCGPAGKLISRLISRYILGVDTNRCCYLHDLQYEAGATEHDRLLADQQFFDNMALAIKCHYHWANPLRYIALIIALRRYHIVRIFGQFAFHHSSAGALAPRSPSAPTPPPAGGSSPSSTLHPPSSPTPPPRDPS